MRNMLVAAMGVVGLMFLAAVLGMLWILLSGDGGHRCLTGGALPWLRCGGVF